jgi:hypothetical protein
MTKDATRLLEDALKLAPTERAELAEELPARLDETEADVERAWLLRLRSEPPKHGSTARVKRIGVLRSLMCAVKC